jgi:hypothetical protein
VRREVTGLDEDASLRPDLLLTLPGRTVLSDVVVCHPLAPGARNTTRVGQLAVAKVNEMRKKKKYLGLSSRHRFVQLPIAIETTGGMGPRTETLVDAMADASAEQLVTWSRESVVRELVGSMAMFVCLLLCIRLVGGFNGNADKTLCWSAVCAASESVGCRCMRTALILKDAGLPTKTSWEKGKGEPAPDSTTGGNIQLSRGMRWATAGRVVPPSVA